MTSVKIVKVLLRETLTIRYTNYRSSAIMSLPNNSLQHVEKGVNHFQYIRIWTGTEFMPEHSQIGVLPSKLTFH